MKLTRSARTRLGLVASVAGVVAAAALVLPSAHAGQSAAGDRPRARSVATLVQTMDATTAGGWRDRATGQWVVNVTDEATAVQVRAQGAQPRMVTYSGATLRASEAELNRLARIPGTTWVIDPVSNRVVVSADQSVRGADLTQLRRAVTAIGGSVRMKQVAGTLSTRIAGGDAILSGNGRCSLGFNVEAGGQAFFLTAGHCLLAGNRFTDANGQLLGTAVANAASFPGNDFAIVRYENNVDIENAVTLGNGQSQPIRRVGQAFVGQQVQRSGSTTGLQDGQVTGLNATVNYPEGQVRGLIQTDVCAEGGDSGGSLFAGDTALGVTSGGSGDCNVGGETFFQPAFGVLQQFGLNVL